MSNSIRAKDFSIGNKEISEIKMINSWKIKKPNRINQTGFFKKEIKV